MLVSRLFWTRERDRSDGFMNNFYCAFYETKKPGCVVSFKRLRIWLIRASRDIRTVGLLENSSDVQSDSFLVKRRGFTPDEGINANDRWYPYGWFMGWNKNDHKYIKPWGYFKSILTIIRDFGHLIIYRETKPKCCKFHVISFSKCNSSKNFSSNHPKKDWLKYS